MSFGGQSNAPWQRNVMQGHPQANTFHQGTQQMFMQNAQQNNMAAFGHGGGGNMYPSGGGPSVSYPQPRSGLNPVAFQQGGGQSQSHYNSIGTVTKINNDCGLVNDEVFFYRNVCKGLEPKLGDRVIFEATYSNNGQFKWNATRIQLMQQQTQTLMGSGKSNYSSVAPPNEYQRGQTRHNSPKRSPVRGGITRNDRDRRDRDRDRSRRSRDRDDNEQERKRRREDRSRDRVNSTNRSTEGRSGGAGHAVSTASGRSERDRERGESRKKERDNTVREREEREKARDRSREKESHRTASKGGRRARTIRRYMVEIPKSLLPHKYSDIQELRQRYTNLYIPSDFFHANIKWTDTFTPDNPFSLARPCQFHIMHKVVDPPFEQKPEILEPADANYLYSAKVMLLALPPIAEIYKKCFESDDDDDVEHHAIHPSRLINFLVGVRGRNEPMAIGGPWSASLDGENPDKDPSVLIRTAIRTCKALTGIDLSNCTQWYRFVELYYHRTEYKNMEKDGPPRVETVVIYLPDIHSCMPSIEEWQTLTQVYKTAADDVIVRRKALVDAAAAAANSNDDNDDKTDDVNMKDNDATLADEEDGAEEISDAAAEDTTQKNDVADEDDVKMDDSTASASADVSGAVSDDSADVVEIIDDDDDKPTDDKPADDKPTDDIAAEAVDQNVTAQEDGDDSVNEKDEPAPEPTHYSELDLKTMKVQEIRDELLARNLSDKGVRNVVMARLAKALNTEKAEETKNKIKFKSSPTKTGTVVKKPNEESATKGKKEDEKMETDQNTSKTEDKKTAENKKADKKVDAKSKTTTAVAKANPKVISTNKKSAAASKDKKDTDDLDDLADIIDFELSDIVILDEYDSSKNPEESLPKEMDEKEKAQLIRRYTLPSSAQIVVHPNKSAKGGKFDCAVMSLSVLLDYHPDDTKERFFEVSLFAEIFNEMLMRDFAFNIYKSIYLYEEPTATNHESETTETKTEDDVKKEKTEPTEEVKKEVKEKESKKEVKDVKAKEKSSKPDSKSSENNSIEKSTKDQHNDDTQSIKSESRKRKISTSVSTSNGKELESSTVAAEKKMVVAKPQLLLSFVYFDTTHCGYIFEKDLEDLFSVLGLNLSRSQIKKVLGKLATRQAIYYRKLTDKEESLEATPYIEDDDDLLPVEELKRIAAGNNLYEKIFGNNNAANQVSAIDGDDNKDGLINFNGAVVHVGKLLNQIKRTEKNYSDLEKLYNDLIKQHSDLQKEHNKSTSKIKDLQSEIKSTSRKLSDANQDLYSLNRKYRDQNSTLSYIYTRVSPYFSREKDKDAKTESSRDKDEKEKEKDKSKEKDSEKEKESPKDDKDKESSKDDKEKETPKDDVEMEIPKDDIETETPKEVNEKEIPKDESVKEKPKNVTEKEKPKDDKAKEKPKEDKEKEKPKEKPKEDKEKEKPKEKSSNKDKESSTPSKGDSKALKKSSDLKSTDKTSKKDGTESAKK